MRCLALASLLFFLGLSSALGAGLSGDALDASGSATDRYIDPVEVRAKLHSATDDFYACFRKHARGQDGVGETSVTFTVTREGTAAGILPEIGRAPAELAPCLVAVLEGLHFGEHDGAPLAVSYPLVYQVDSKGARILPYPIVFTRPSPVRLPLLQLPADLSGGEVRILEWILTEEAPPPKEVIPPPKVEGDAAPVPPSSSPEPE